MSCLMSLTLSLLVCLNFSELCWQSWRSERSVISHFFCTRQGIHTHTHTLVECVIVAVNSLCHSVVGWICHWLIVSSIQSHHPLKGVGRASHRALCFHIMFSYHLLVSYLVLLPLYLSINLDWSTSHFLSFSAADGKMSDYKMPFTVSGTASIKTKRVVG